MTGKKRTVIASILCFVFLVGGFLLVSEASAQTIISDANPIKLVLTTNGGITLEATGQEKYIQIWNRSSNTFKRINLADTNIQSLDADTNNIAFIVYRSSDSIVNLYNIASGQLTTLDNSGSNKRNIKIYGNNIVWEDYASGDPVIVLYNLSNKSSKVIGSGYTQQYSPVISAKYAAWIARNNGQDTICIYDLATGKPTLVQNTENQKLSLSLYDKKLVWAETREAGDTAPTVYSSDRYFDWVWGSQASQSVCNIWMYDITSKTTTRLTNSYSNQVQPTIVGNQVAWVDTGSGNPDVQVIDLTTRRITTIASTDTFEVQPALGYGYIAWIDLKGNLGDLQVEKLASTTVTTPTAPVVVAPPTIKVAINGTSYTMSPAPYLKSDRTMVPMRKIFELLGAEVTWNDSEKSVTAVKAGTTIKLYIGKTTATVNRVTTTLDAAPELKNSSTMIPVRFVSEALGCTVGWNEQSRTVTISQ